MKKNDFIFGRDGSQYKVTKVKQKNGQKTYQIRDKYGRIGVLKHAL
jgi:hypothetical protein